MCGDELIFSAALFMVERGIFFFSVSHILELTLKKCDFFNNVINLVEIFYKGTLETLCSPETSSFNFLLAVLLMFFIFVYISTLEFPLLMFSYVLLGEY